MQNNIAPKVLSDEDEGRIARKFLIRMLSKDNYALDAQTIKRELPNAAKDIGESEENVLAFAQGIIPEILGKRLGAKAVSIVW